MSNQDEEFLAILLETFKEEAKEHTMTLTNLLIDLENQKDDTVRATIVENAFREAHSLKGAARSVNKTSIELLCKSIESLFSILKQKLLPLNSEFFKAIHKTVSLIVTLIDIDEKDFADDISNTIETLQNIYNNLSNNTQEITNISKKIEEKTEEKVVTLPEEKMKIIEDIIPVEHIEKTKVSVDKLALMIKDIEELLYVKLSFKKHIEMIKTTNNLFEQLKELKKDEKLVSRMIDNLLNESKKLLMFPFTTLLDSFPKMVYDIASEQNKKVEFISKGANLEIDKRILEQMKDPLIHILRNAIDHGIEDTKTRKEKNKDETAKLTISITSTDNSKVKIDIVDDGAGIDIEKVKQIAIEKRIVLKEVANTMSDNELAQLIFYSGITTNKMVTNLSGRGLGLAIVMEKALKLGGEVLISDTSEKGTTLSIILPMMMATYRGVLVKESNQDFIIPVSSVLHAVKVEQKDIKTIEERDVIYIDDEMLPIFFLKDLLKLKIDTTKEIKEKNLQGIIIEVSNEKMILIVDEIVTETEILTKNLGLQLKRVKNIGGCTILSNGQIAFLLNISDLLISAKNNNKRVVATVGDKKIDNKTILMVDDSITTRTLLKNILELSGYNVISAVDGVDGFLKLIENKVNLVVSDVDMPNMDGFELTKKIKDDKRFEELPVILVTALESSQDKLRGLEVGANAYIIKSTFDQNNLLETIGWMI